MLAAGGRPEDIRVGRGRWPGQARVEKRAGTACTVPAFVLFGRVPNQSGMASVMMKFSGSTALPFTSTS